MNTPTKIDVDAATEAHLAKLAMSDPEMLLAGLEARADWQATSGLDSRTYSLVKVAALIALDAPPASYLWQVANAVEDALSDFGVKLNDLPLSPWKIWSLIKASREGRAVPR